MTDRVANTNRISQKITANVNSSASDTMEEAKGHAAEEEASYTRVLQGNSTNALIFAPNSVKRIQRDEITGMSTLESTDGVLLTVGDLTAEKGLSPQTQKIFAILLERVTSRLPRRQEATLDKIDRARQISLPLSDYMSICGIRDLRTARDQLNAAIDELSDIKYEFDERVFLTPLDDDKLSQKSRRKTPMHYKMPIAGLTGTSSGKAVHNNIAYFSFDMDFAKFLCLHAYIMPIPKAIFNINTQANPNSLSLAWRLHSLHNMNYGKAKRRDIESVEAIMRACSSLPRYEDQIKIGHIFKKIIEPFDRDLNALVEKYSILTMYEYLDEEGQKVERIRLGGLTYSDFIKLQVHYELNDYPDDDQKLRIKKLEERKRKAAERRAAAKKAKEEAEAQAQRDHGDHGQGASAPDDARDQADQSLSSPENCQ